MSSALAAGAAPKPKTIKNEKQKKERQKKRQANYRLIQKEGIHPRETLRELESREKANDQKNRNRLAQKFKAQYHQNYSLSKAFKETVKSEKLPDVSKEN